MNSPIHHSDSSSDPIQRKQEQNNTESGSKPAPLRSVYTTNLPPLLTQLGISLVVSTYQTGKLVVIRADENAINTHFLAFKKPMGIACDRSRLALGTAHEVWEFRNIPDVAAKLEPLGKYDACFLPRTILTTGDIDVHEMAWVGDDLWVVNTRFSCLCTLNPSYSFVPRWRPPFVKALAPEDRCHLNGLGVANGRPKYVTALGETDAKQAWRENKANGGILMDVDSNTILLRGLSMPHSPRWYGDRLWFLESGKGSLACADLGAGTWSTVAQLPGFTRGLDFYGNLAFIGLSQVRETAVFSGIPITEKLEDRICGIWVVEVQTGKTVGFLKFEEAVQEIFSVQVLQGTRFPEINNDDDKLIGSSYILPDDALIDVPPEMREVPKVT